MILILYVRIVSGQINCPSTKKCDIYVSNKYDPNRSDCTSINL